MPAVFLAQACRVSWATCGLLHGIWFRQDPCFNMCRFVVPEEVQPTFVASWREREQDMQQHSGFVDFKLEQDGDKFVVSSR